MGSRQLYEEMVTMNKFKEERIAELKAKAEIANADFELLIQEDTIAFYESCEMTQIMLMFYLTEP